MLLQARKKNIPSTGTGLRVLGDAQKMPLPDNSFSGVLCGYGMRNLPDVSQGLRECFRILAPGGVLMVAEFFRPTTWLEKVFYHGLAPLFIPALGAIAAGDKAAYVYLVESVKRFLTPQEFAQRASEVGFLHPKIFSLDGGITYLIRVEKPLSSSGVF
jgi:demethylmenaquinone methyltransferase/2-methoxy-6-polyprenyl-1,4-benzoquinol methylase